MDTTGPNPGEADVGFVSVCGKSAVYMAIGYPMVAGMTVIFLTDPPAKEQTCSCIQQLL